MYNIYSFTSLNYVLMVIHAPYEQASSSLSPSNKKTKRRQNSVKKSSSCVRKMSALSPCMIQDTVFTHFDQ